MVALLCLGKAELSTTLLVSPTGRRMEGVALILATHLEHTTWLHRGHFLLLQNSPNLVFTHWKQILPSITFFLVDPSSGKASISALAWTLLMWPTSSKLRLVIAKDDDTCDQLLVEVGD